MSVVGGWVLVWRSRPASSPTPRPRCSRFARSSRVAADREEANLLVAACEWADLHPAETVDDAAAFWLGGGSEHEEPVAGPGAPLVAEFCIAEFGAALGISTVSAKHLIGQALELRHRLPRLWRRVQAGDLPSWRARRIAETTIHAGLSRESGGVRRRPARTVRAPHLHQSGRPVGGCRGRPVRPRPRRRRSPGRRGRPARHDRRGAGLLRRHHARHRRARPRRRPRPRRRSRPGCGDVEGTRVRRAVGRPACCRGRGDGQGSAVARPACDPFGQATRATDRPPGRWSCTSTSPRATRSPDWSGATSRPSTRSGTGAPRPTPK